LFGESACLEVIDATTEVVMRLDREFMADQMGMVGFNIFRLHNLLRGNCISEKVALIKVFGY
jgi:hypothetical protein